MGFDGDKWAGVHHTLAHLSLSNPIHRPPRLHHTPYAGPLVSNIPYIPAHSSPSHPIHRPTRLQHTSGPVYVVCWKRVGRRMECDGDEGAGVWGLMETSGLVYIIHRPTCLYQTPYTGPLVSITLHTPAHSFPTYHIHRPTRMLKTSGPVYGV